MEKRSFCFVGKVGAFFLLVSFILIPISISPSISLDAENASAGSYIEGGGEVGGQLVTKTDPLVGLTIAPSEGLDVAAVAAVVAIGSLVSPELESSISQQ